MYPEEPVFELKTGMMVQLKNGKYYHVLRDITLNGRPNKGALQSAEGEPILYLSSYDRKLFYQSPKAYNTHNYSPLDIEKVYEPCVASAIGKTNEMLRMSTLVWERAAKPKSMTLKEIEAALGYPIKLAVNRSDVGSVMKLIDKLFE